MFTFILSSNSHAALLLYTSAWSEQVTYFCASVSTDFLHIHSFSRSTFSIHTDLVPDLGECDWHTNTSVFTESVVFMYFTLKEYITVYNW